MIYEVGPSRPAANINDLPWATIGAGDTVKIHWRPEPYREVLCIGNSGTPSKPFVVEGVPNATNALPVIDFDRGVPPAALQYWNGDRGGIRIAGSSVPNNQYVTDLTVRNLCLRNAKFNNRVNKADGTLAWVFAENTSAIQVEKGARLTFENLLMEDCGCGIFAGSVQGSPEWDLTRDIIVRNCTMLRMGLADNGQVHGNYTNVVNVLYEGCHISMINNAGTAIKSRDSELTVRYCTIDGGNYVIDAINSTVAESERKKNPNAPRVTQVYGNLLIKRNRFQQEAVFHFGVDTADGLPQGDVYFHHNTIALLHRSQAILFLINHPTTKVYSYNNYFFIPNQVGVTGNQDQDNPGKFPYYGVTASSGGGRLILRGCVLPDATLAPGEKPPFSATVFGYKDGAGVDKAECLHANAIDPTRFLDYVLETDIGERIGAYHHGTDGIKRLAGTFAPVVGSPLIGAAKALPAGAEAVSKNWGGTARKAWVSVGAVEFGESAPTPPDPPVDPPPVDPPPVDPPPTGSLDARLVSLRAAKESILTLRSKAKAANDEIAAATAAYERDLAAIRLVIQDFDL